MIKNTTSVRLTEKAGYALELLKFKNSEKTTTEINEALISAAKELYPDFEEKWIDVGKEIIEIQEKKILDRLLKKYHG